MLDNRYNFLESEPKWQKFWQDEGIYKFNPSSNKETFSIDTPPPTVSGKIHIGHIFSYSQAYPEVPFLSYLLHLQRSAWAGSEA